MAALALGFTSCKQEEDPKYKAPNAAEFKVNVPGLADQEFVTASDMTDGNTFNLFCSQPDYGFSAVCNYSAVVSLDPTCPADDEDLSRVLPNENITSASMAIKTYELAVAVNQLLGIKSADEFANDPRVKEPMKLYFRAICEIPTIEGSRVVSSNVVSYNKVRLQYAEKKPAWIYICGYVQTLENTNPNNFLPPTDANLQLYDAYYRLYEPDNMIGEKIFVGQFNLVPQAANAENPVDGTSNFRFFTQLLGWKADASLGSAEGDFFKLDVTDAAESTAGYKGDVVNQGLGNWGIMNNIPADPKPVTIVVDTKDLKIYIKTGLFTPQFQGREPVFNAN